MPDPGLRARVERLLRGDFRSDDLTRLFLYARDRCDGRESVQEIGDFVAHHDERTKGLITREARDWYMTVRFASLNFPPHQIEWNRLPSHFSIVLQASLRRALPDFFKDHLKLSRMVVKKSLPSIIGKLITNKDGTFSISPAHTQFERRILLFMHHDFNEGGIRRRQTLR
jgi:hypothetical protein